MKNKIIILIGIIGLIFPLKINALSGDVSLTCDKNKVSPNSTINCSIKGNINEEVSSVHAEIELGSNLTLENSQSSSIWEGDGDGGIYDLYTDENKTGSFDIGTFTIKVGNVTEGANTYISLKNLTLSDASFKEQNFSVSSINVRIGSTVNKLTNITVTEGTLSFDDNTTEYNLTIDSPNTEITATKKDINSTVTGDIGLKTLKYGLNTFKITIKSESGEDNVYILNITRPDNRSQVNALSTLTISKGTLKFNKDTTNYNVTVKSDVDKVELDATLTDDKSSFVYGYGPRTVDLKVGKNTIEIKVVAENESVKTYKINVTREDNRSSNNYLSKLILNEGKISFDKETLEYETTVLYEIDKIEVEAETEDNKAKCEVKGNDKLIVGENIITIKVTAENESVKTYKIKVIRKEESETLSNNSNLSSLNIEEYPINFNTNQYEYNLKIKEETTLNITYETEETGSVVTVHGNEELKNGSLIRVKVTAEDGTETEYKIRIEKEENSILMYIVIGSTLLLIIIIIIMIILTKKKKKPSNEEIINNVNDIPVNQNASNMQYQAYPNMNNGMQNFQDTQNIYPNVLNQQSTVNNQNIHNNQNYPSN